MPRDINKRIENLLVENRNLQEEINNLLLKFPKKKYTSSKYDDDIPTATTRYNNTIISGITNTDKYSNKYINEYQMNYGKLKPTSNVAKQLPQLDKTTKLSITEFNDRTHYCYVAFHVIGQYKKVTTTKLVGKVDIEWWEYVLLFGIMKKIKMLLALDNNKSMIDKPKVVEDELDKFCFNVVFKPKMEGRFENRIENIEGTTYNVRYGIKYPQLVYEIPIEYDDGKNMSEIVEDNLLYEEEVDSLVPNYSRTIENLNEKIKSFDIPDQFRSIIAKEIYARLRGI